MARVEDYTEEKGSASVLTRREKSIHTSGDPLEKTKFHILANEEKVAYNYWYVPGTSKGCLAI